MPDLTRCHPQLQLGMQSFLSQVSAKTEVEKEHVEIGEVFDDDKLVGEGSDWTSDLMNVGFNCHKNLVMEVLQRFKHTRKLTFQVFCCVAKRPRFAHDSRTYNYISVLGRTR